MGGLNIAVTGINASDNPAPGVGVAKSLKADPTLEANVIGLAYDAMEPGIYMDWFIDKAYLVPYPTAGDGALVERLLYIKERSGLDVVIPTLDAELPFFIRAQGALARAGIQTFLPDEWQLRLRDKQYLPALAMNAGLFCPEQRLVSTTAEVADAAAEIGFPLMVKGALYGAYRAHTLDEALGRFHQVAAQWGTPVILQRAVSGTEMNVIGVGDGTGQASGLVAIKKMTVTGMGKIWSGVTIDHPALLAAAERLVSLTRWRGAFELECIVEGDRVHLIEVNPRFPAWVYFATGVGINLPALLVRRALGEESDPAAPYAAGQLYVRYTDERVCDMSRFQNMVTQGES